MWGYGYSGVHHAPRPWPPALAELRGRVWGSFPAQESWSAGAPGAVRRPASFPAQEGWSAGAPGAVRRPASSPAQEGWSGKSRTRCSQTFTRRPGQRRLAQRRRAVTWGSAHDLVAQPGCHPALFAAAPHYGQEASPRVTSLQPARHGRSSQRCWQHCLPKTASPVGRRVNLTFRCTAAERPNRRRREG
jgi:hypothetical protein